MYFPHLFARRSELLALRDVCAEFSIARTIVPILEPLKAKSDDLRRCLAVLGEAQVRTLVVTNPYLGDFLETGPATWRATLTQDFDKYPSLLPTFLCRGESRITEITTFLNRYPNREVAIIYWSPRFTDAELQGLVAERRIRYHVNLHDQLSAAQRELLPRAKAVDVRDHFHAQPRNADYIGQEFFSDHHLTFARNSIGYGDFSVIGSRYVPGGGPAHAVAIHAVFRQRDTNNLWVEHFVSDDTDIRIGSVDEKFLQAARKLVRAVTRRPMEFGANGALAGYAEDVRTNHSSGLAMNKRREIHHHIALNHQILTNRL